MTTRHMSVRELADSTEYGSVFTERYTRRLIYEQRIPYLKIGSKVFITQADIDHFLNSNRVEAVSA
jgi:hypothetical protein